MKKWIHLILTLGALAAGVSSCIMDIDNELPDCLPGETVETLPVKAFLYCNDRRIDWPEHSRIGVAMLKEGIDEFVYTPSTKQYFLSDPADHLFDPYTVQDQIFRPASGVVQEAAGVYPYGVAPGQAPEVTFSIADQTDQQALDLLIARRTGPITSATDTVRLDFFRRLSRLQFDLSLTELAADGTRTNQNDRLAGAQIEIVGLPTSARFSLNDDSYTLDRQQTFATWIQTDGRAGQAIVFPRRAAEGVVFRVTLPHYPDTVYTFQMDPELELAACKTYRFALDLIYSIENNPDHPDNPDNPDTPDNPDNPSALQHKINYVFEGEANSGNVDVYKNGTSTRWNSDEIITVDDHSQFIFSYRSDLTVTIRLGNGDSYSVRPGEPVTLRDITSDITIILSARKKEDTPPPAPSLQYTVRYRFEGDANKENVRMEQGGSAWPADKIFSVAPGSHFTFTCDPDETKIFIEMVLDDGSRIEIDPSDRYTLTNIRRDIVIVISGEKLLPEPGLPDDGTATKQEIISAEVVDWVTIPVVDDSLVPEF